MAKRTGLSGQTAGLLKRLRFEGDVDVVVDVSNVCKDRDLGARWGSLLTLLDAIASHLGVSRVHAILVVDNSLLTGSGSNPLSPREREIAKLVIDECGSHGETSPFVLVGHADEEVLTQAMKHDAKVVTNDRFREYYRDHPWLKEGKGRLLGWVCRAGKAQVGPVQGINTGVWTDSRAKQNADLQRLPDHAQRELYDWWLICQNRRCRMRGARLVFGDPEGSRWAHFQRRFVCSECGQPAGRDGRRPAGRDFYVIWGEDTRVATYLVAEGQSLTVGAGPEADVDVFREPGGIVRDLPRPSPEQRERIDAPHCRIACENGELAVTDLGSRYGTSVRRMRHSELVTVDALTPGTPAKLWHGDVATLGDLIGLRTSGRPLPHGVPASAG